MSCNVLLSGTNGFGEDTNREGGRKPGRPAWYLSRKARQAASNRNLRNFREKTVRKRRAEGSNTDIALAAEMGLVLWRRTGQGQPKRDEKNGYAAQLAVYNEEPGSRDSKLDAVENWCQARLAYGDLWDLAEFRRERVKRLQQEQQQQQWQERKPKKKLQQQKMEQEELQQLRLSATSTSSYPLQIAEPLRLPQNITSHCTIHPHQTNEMMGNLHELSMLGMVESNDEMLAQAVATTSVNIPADTGHIIQNILLHPEEQNLQKHKQHTLKNYQRHDREQGIDNLDPPSLDFSGMVELRWYMQQEQPSDLALFDTENGTVSAFLPFGLEQPQQQIHYQIWKPVEMQTRQLLKLQQETQQEADAISSSRNNASLFQVPIPSPDTHLAPVLTPTLNSTAYTIYPSPDIQQGQTFAKYEANQRKEEILFISNHIELKEGYQTARDVQK